MGVSKNQGLFFGSRCNKDHDILRSIVGLPIWRSHHVSSGEGRSPAERQETEEGTTLEGPGSCSSPCSPCVFTPKSKVERPQALFAT